MASQREIAEQEITELMGFVPDFYRSLPVSALNAAWQLDKTFELGETVLDAKTKELIGLAVASQLKCRYCVYFHSKAAEAFGASQEELKEAALMGGLTAMMSSTITANQVDFEKFKMDVDSAIEHLMKQASEGQAKGQAAPPPLQ